MKRDNPSPGPKNHQAELKNTNQFQIDICLSDGPEIAFSLGMKKQLWIIVGLGLGACGPAGMKTATPLQTNLGVIQSPQEALKDLLTETKVRGVPSGTDAASGLKILNQARVTWPDLSEILGQGDLITIQKFLSGSDTLVSTVSQERTTTEYLDTTMPATLGLKYDYRLKVMLDEEELLSEKMPFETKVLPKPLNPDLLFSSNHIAMLSLEGSAVHVGWKDRSDNETGFEYQPFLMCDFGAGLQQVGMDLSGITPDHSQTYKVSSADPETTEEMEALDSLTIPYIMQPGSNIQAFCTQKALRYKIRAVNASGASDWVQTEDLDF